MQDDCLLLKPLWHLPPTSFLYHGGVKHLVQLAGLGELRLPRFSFLVAFIIAI